jgi:chemotaxis protein MotB
VRAGFEAQQYTEHISGQVRSIRQALATLSEVLVSELEQVQNDTSDRLDALEARVAASESHTQETRSAVTRLQDQVAALHASAASSSETQRKMVADVTSTSQAVEAAAAASAACAQQLAALRQELDAQSDAARAVTSSLASRVTASSERIDALQATFRSTPGPPAAEAAERLSELKGAVAELQLRADETSTELAVAMNSTTKDVVAVMTELGNLRQAFEQQRQFSTRHEDALTQLRAYLDEVRDAVSAQLTTVAGQTSGQVESLSAAISSYSGDLTALRSWCEAAIRDQTVQVRRIAAAQRSLVDGVAAARTESSQEVTGLEQDTRRRFDAVTSAIGVLGDLLHISGVSEAQDAGLIAGARQRGPNPAAAAIQAARRVVGGL